MKNYSFEKSAELPELGFPELNTVELTEINGGLVLANPGEVSPDAPFFPLPDGPCFPEWLAYI